MSKPAITIENIGKRYRLGQTHEHTLSDRLVRLARQLGGKATADVAPAEEFWALRDINLEIGEGDSVGIVGGNGAGKSTLLKILSRITQPSTGRVLVRGRMSSLLEVGTGFHPELTGRENVFLNGTILGMRRAEIARKFDEIVAFSGVEKFIDTPVKRYSSGMHVRLAFAVAAHLEPDVLIIDEVLAVGDSEFQKRCLGKMDDVAREGRTVIFVSHNMAAIQKLCSRAVWIRKGQLAGNGAPTDVIDAYLDSLGAPTGTEVFDAPGYMYRYDPHAAAPQDARVISLQALGRDDRPLREIGTWDPVRFRIEFEVRGAFPSFSAELQIWSRDGVPLFHSSTSPDQNRPFGVIPGRYRVDCDFEQFPLAQGDYQIGLRLAIPCIEYVWRNDALCKLHVAARDIFDSGKPPASINYLVATAHQWSAPQALLAQQVAEPK